ncbi:hypothetical protein LHJ74_06080 [Streptomyces sp. N2-109]|uniref:Uncharacterized protein n=1 Tax=Streptomyces gossypii TaxID=2883101 RepID=A0ABT2JNN5_9ACTN|nr:hypothetical protein [Streptomyces gossypii]MCT2589498.1 hypothetical protein [Streptomyces gossypii]
MTAPPLKRRPATDNGPDPATPGPAHSGRSAPKVVARQGVPSALRPDPHTGDGPTPLAWLHITAPGRRTVPSATSVCACGWDRSAIGERRVLALIADHDTHRQVCPLRTTKTEGRAAA